MWVYVDRDCHKNPARLRFIQVLYIYCICIESVYVRFSIARCCQIESGDGGALKRFHHKAENLPWKAKTIKNIAENRTKG